MTFFFSIQNTYHSVEIALFNNDQLLELIVEDKTQSSKHFIPIIADILIKHQIKLSDISFFAVNQGPGPFTTLRVVIASVNGLSFASNIPLIGIDALDAFLLEHQNNDWPNTVVLLNAFNNDVYFGIQQKNNPEYKKGYDNINVILEKIKTSMPETPIRFLGNGVELHAQEIRNMFGQNAIIPDPLPQTCTVQQIGLMGLEKWKKRQGLEHQLFPLYLKQSMN